MFHQLAMATLIALPPMLLTGCVGNMYATEGYSLKHTAPQPARLMSARRIERPLYIVLDERRIPNTWELKSFGCYVEGSILGGPPPGYTCERFGLRDVHTFVERDLKAALSEHFDRVEVVKTDAERPRTPHIVADIRIDAIDLRNTVRDERVSTLIEMRWGFAFRRSQDMDYTYTFIGTSSSDDFYLTFEDGLESLIENALAAMLKEWQTEGGPATLRG